MNPQLACNMLPTLTFEMRKHFLTLSWKRQDNAEATLKTYELSQN
jgi:hypothetical protein